MTNQQWNIVHTFAQGRQRNCDYTEAIIQVFTELFIAHSLTHIPVGRGNDSDVHGRFFGFADGSNPSLLDGSEQLSLAAIRHFENVIEENRAAICRTEQTGRVAESPCERAFLVAEQLAFDQVTWHCSTIYRNKRFAGPRSVVVNGLGYQLFSSATFASYQHGAICSSGSINLLIDDLHVPTRADNVIKAILVAQFRAQL